MAVGFFRYTSIAFLTFFASCANIGTPSGGKKDATPPKLVRIAPSDSLLETKVKKIELHFDEYVTVSDAVKEVTIAPILPVLPTVTSKGKAVTVKIVDSLLEENTTYRLSFGNSIKDVHEGNAFTGYTYTFSTGTYFDSLSIVGSVLDAATGQPDSGSATIMLYYATESDSAVILKKPKYISRTDASGSFKFSGLPKRNFKVYAVKDVNTNLIYDGPDAGELIAFSDTVVLPADTSIVSLHLRLFKELPDTLIRKQSDTLSTKLKPKGKGKERMQPVKENIQTLEVRVDTSDPTKRTFDITKRLELAVARGLKVDTSKIRLCDSEGNRISGATIVEDTANGRKYCISVSWKENTLYRLKLIKGYAQDSAGGDFMPVGFSFRTKQEDDYGKIKLHIPSKYGKASAANTQGYSYLIRVMADNDSVYQQVVTDTVLMLKRLKPAKYTFRIIVDKNDNGVWDTGDLLGRQQPEVSIPFPEMLKLKAGWEHVVDLQDTSTDRKKEVKKKQAGGGVK